MRWKLLKDYHSLSAESRAELEGLLAKVEPMKEIARLICSHMEGILVWAQTRQTNGFLETLNGLFQAAKRKARGYGRFSTIRTVLFLLTTRLDVSTLNPHVGTQPT